MEVADIGYACGVCFLTKERLPSQILPRQTLFIVKQVKLKFEPMLHDFAICPELYGDSTHKVVGRFKILNNTIMLV